MLGLVIFFVTALLAAFVVWTLQSVRETDHLVKRAPLPWPPAPKIAAPPPSAAGPRRPPGAFRSPARTTAACPHCGAEIALSAKEPR